MDNNQGWDIEKALEAAGSWHRFQKLVLIMSLVSAIPNAFVSLHFAFSQYEPRHHCTYPKEYLTHQANQSVEDPLLISVMIPDDLNEQSERVLSQCKMYERNYSHYRVNTWLETFENQKNSNIVDCMTGLSYEFSETEETAVTEFSMVCDDDWKAPLAVSLYAIGRASSCFFGVFADWYGRRRIFIASSILQIFCQVANACAWSYPVYCIAIMMGGAVGIINYNVFFVLATEVTDRKRRNALSLSSSFGFAIGYCSVALFAYIFRQWRYFIGVMAAFGAVIYIPCCWYFPESPRWLAQKGESDEAMRNLRMIARMNGRTKLFEQALMTQEKKRIIAKNDDTSTGMAETIRVFFRSGISSRFFTTAYGWVITAMAYLSFSVYSTDFNQDRFINFLLGGLIEFPSYVVVFASLKYLGRPRTTLLLMSICGVSSIVVPFIPAGLETLSAAFAILGKGAIAAVYFAWYLISTEVLPTLQRSSALCICSTISQIGSFCSPYLMYFRKYNYWLPNLIMGIACTSAGILGIFLIPETLGVSLPDTAQEARANKRFYGFSLGKKFGKVKSHMTSTDEEHEKLAMI